MAAALGRSLRLLLRRGHKGGQALFSRATSSSTATESRKRRRLGSNVPSLSEFMHGQQAAQAAAVVEPEEHAYLSAHDMHGHGRKVFFETYGCQMNVADADVAWSVLKGAGYTRATAADDADAVLLVTCAIRENAEQKIWNRLDALKSAKLTRSRQGKDPLFVGVLGCMAERLKHTLLESGKGVDVVAGPDAYRSLPQMLAQASDGEAQVNVLLSLEETYADIAPVRLGTGPSAFLSIQRGCDNMCAYCIVPFTRGRERSRPIDSIVEEALTLASQGVRDITLLGQNVNSYRDVTQPVEDVVVPTAAGFSTIYKPKRKSKGMFTDLITKVAEAVPDCRVRFTSPHPKDFPDELLYTIAEYNNVCNHVHMPAQSGSDEVLARMRRGYTKEAYLSLVDKIRSIIPGVSISSDFIVGFCGETDDDFLATVDLVEQVRYDSAFMFAYSLRPKTHAHRRLDDDVPQDVKLARLKHLVDLFYPQAAETNAARIGQRHLVLVEKESKRSSEDLVGRADINTKVVFPATPIPDKNSGQMVVPQPGDFVEVCVTGATATTLLATPLSISSIATFSA